MQRDSEQILLNRLLVRLAVAKIPLNTLLSPKELEELDKIQKKITPNTKRDKIAGLSAIVEKLGKAVTTPNVLAKIKENFIKEGALSQKEALKIIYPQDPKLVIPVITKVIEDLLEKVKKRQPQSVATNGFLEAALAKIKDVDEKQNGNIIQLVALIPTLKKDKIRADMLPLIEKVNGVAFVEAEAISWFEAILWIEGHFLREHEKALDIGREAKGTRQLIFTDDPEIVDVIDDEDKKVKFAAGTTKHFINSFFHAMAVLLEQKAKRDLRLDFSIVDVFPTKIVEEFSVKDLVASSPTVTTEKEERKQPLSMAPVIHFPSAETLKYTIENAPGDKHKLTTFIPASCTPERIAEAMRMFALTLNGESLLSRLKYSVERKVEDKNLFGFMKLALEQCVLTGREDDIIHGYMPEFETLVDQNYNKASLSGYKIRLYGERTHTAEVNKMFDGFKRDADGKRKTTLEIVTSLQAMWEKANKDASTLLFSVLETLIKEMRDKLILHLEPQSHLSLSTTGSGAALQSKKK